MDSDLAQFAPQSSPVFPVEIFDLIIEDLLPVIDDGAVFTEREDFFANISTCSLVCKAFLPLCRKRLLRQIQLGYTKRRKAYKRVGLARLIQQQPYLATYVQDLRYDFTRGTNDTALGEKADPCLFDLLTLPNITSLIVSATSGYGYYKNSNTAHFGFRHVLDHFLFTATLTELRIFSIRDVPLFDVLACPSIKTLYIGSCTFDRTEFLNRGSDTEAPSFNLEYLSASGLKLPYRICCFMPELRSFDADFEDHKENTLESIRNIRPLPFRKLEWLRPHELDIVFSSAAKLEQLQPFPSLKSLQLFPYFQTKAVRTEKLLECCNTLEALKIEAVTNHGCLDGLGFADALQRCKATFQKLHLMWFINEYDERIIQDLCDALFSIRKENCFRDLKLWFVVTDAWNNKLLHRPLEAWKRLDSILQQDLSDFPSLKNVEIEIRAMVPKKDMQTFSQQSKSLFVDPLQQALYRLYESPMVKSHIHIHTEEGCSTGTDVEPFWDENLDLLDSDSDSIII